MKSLLASIRRGGGLDRADAAVMALEEGWRQGEPALERHWAAHDPEGTISVLAALIKADLRCRFARGKRPTVHDYLGRFPALGAEKERMLSLIYEEFCLREEQGERPDVASFCDRYAPWRDSLASQLEYHQLISRVVGPTEPPPRFPEPGEHFQEFAIDENLGQGGAARVYRARNDLLGGRAVALKVSPDRGQEPSFLGRLDHEHIVPVHSVVIQPETKLRGLIMPYRPGLPLDKVIARVDPSSRPRAARVLWEVVAASAPADCRAPAGRPGWDSFPMRGTYAEGVAWIIAALARAVAHAHDRDIYHRDIKPANVLLTLQHGPQLLDFNLAHDPHAADQAEAALRGGTLPYMAPEQLEAFLDPERWDTVGAAADLYSLGLVMHELLTGQAPEVPDQSLPLPRAIRSLLDRRVDHRFAPRRLNPAIPHALEAITTRCLAYREADRYPHAQALADDLQRFLDRRPLEHALNPSVPERLGNWSRRHWLLLASGALAGGAGAYATLRRLTPVEDRAEFLAAVTAVDKGSYDKAIGLLVPLDEAFPDHPLVQFYYSAALGLAGQVDDAAKHLPRALRVPDGETALRAWCQDHSDAIRVLGWLGITLDNGVPVRAGEVRRYRPLADAALRAAIHMGSKDENVYIYDAVFDEAQQRHELALEKLMRLREEINGWYRSQSELANHLNACNYYRIRARIIIKIADGWKHRGLPKHFERARACYIDALRDLERGERLIARDDPEKWEQQDLLRAEAELGLSEVALRLDRRPEAAEHFQRADTILADHDADENFKWLRRTRATPLRRQLDRGSSQAPSVGLATPPS